MNTNIRVMTAVFIFSLLMIMILKIVIAISYLAFIITLVLVFLYQNYKMNRSGLMKHARNVIQKIKYEFIKLIAIFLYLYSIRVYISDFG